MDPSAASAASIEALRQAEATIALLQTYIIALASTIGLMGTFFGVKWISAMVEATKASIEQANSNTRLADAVKGLTDAVVRERG